ncbi:MAG: hypothetical protein CVV46_15225 [Spirochaetae bacterium HGW-Spirochaetae-2]|jgi:hypothetical protein|nr:MAG: hypothetical protein CVV46_15225 [Spirochaetae bacterium HGW-Spirochaetae-2]
MVGKNMLALGLSMALTTMVVLVGCGQDFGDLKGMKIYITRTPTDVTRSEIVGNRLDDTRSARYDSSNSIGGDYYQPKDISIGFDKIWFPEKTVYDEILEEETNLLHEDGYATIIDRSTIPPDGYFKPIASFTEVTASTSEPYIPASLPEFGQSYFGLLIDTVYYEFEMEDFAIRWYIQDHSEYQAKDVLIREPEASVWKFAYYQQIGGTLVFVLENERKPVLSGDNLYSTTSDGYFCIVTDGEQDGESGIQNRWESFIHPMLIASHKTAANPSPFDNPNRIDIFGEDKNEAQYYLFQICLNMGCDFSNNRYGGLLMEPGIKSPQSEDDPLTYAQFIHIIQENLDSESDESDPLDRFPAGYQIFTSIEPIGTGIETRFGYIDFENRPQGEFSPSAGW